MGKLTGRIAIVTGAAAGIGKGIALLYADEGADVAVVDKNGARAAETAAVIQGKGRRSLAITADVGDEAAVTKDSLTTREAQARTIVSTFFTGLPSLRRAQALAFCDPATDVIDRDPAGAERDEH